MVQQTSQVPAPIKLSVTVGKPELVVPAVPREDEVYFVSNADQSYGHVLIKTVYLYKAKEGIDADPAVVLKEALAKVLVDYYPLAGRLFFNEKNMLHVNYSSQGAVFVEAFADANLAIIGDITQPQDYLQQLVYTVPDATSILETPFVAAQVTKFQCGGFALGLQVQHIMFDGTAANEFLHAWGKAARGIPYMTPFLDRTILKARVPPQVDYPHHEFDQLDDLSKKNQLDLSGAITRSFIFTPAMVEGVKKTAMDGGGLTRCSTFEVLAALIWKARNMSLKMEPEQQTRLYMVVDGRRRFSTHMPTGYHGNSIFLAHAVSSAAELDQKPLSYAVQLIQSAITQLTDSYMRSHIDLVEQSGAREGLQGSIILTTWHKLPFHKTDFGWGETWQFGAVDLPDPHMVLFEEHGEGRRSTNVLLSLKPDIMEKFAELVKEIA